jgi:hypothetical protein
MQRLLPALLVLALSATTAFAQATRTWVSGVGDDANPCSRTAPCKTFAGAISKTAAGGEIDALDPGGYGAVTISKGMTIDGGATLASILSSAVTGINVNTVSPAPLPKVFLRNLSINGAGTTLGTIGIRILKAAEVHIEDCVLENFSQYGISVETDAEVFVKNTIIHNAGLGGIRVQPNSPARIVLENVKVATSGKLATSGSGYGLLVGKGSKGVVRDSTASSNDGPGFWAADPGSELTLLHAVSFDNLVGLRASEGALVRTLDLVAVNNASDGLLAETNAAIVGYTGNVLAGNGANLAACELADEAAVNVSCPAVTANANCPTCPACPAPVCPAPQLTTGVQNCKSCKTKKGVTTCSRCTVAIK